MLPQNLARLNVVKELKYFQQRLIPTSLRVNNSPHLTSNNRITPHEQQHPASLTTLLKPSLPSQQQPLGIGDVRNPNPNPNPNITLL